MLKYEDLHIGNNIHWCDPETEEIDTYKILDISEDLGENTILVISNGYIIAEVFLSECS